jgi:branched-chain amino acid aminotransferase
MPNTNPYLWRSGEIVPTEEATIHVRSVGHASVSSVFEGINAYRSATDGTLNIFRLGDHLQRLVDSTRLARLDPTFSLDELVRATVALLQRNKTSADTHIRPWTFAAGNPIEQMVQADVPTETIIDSWPFSSGLETGREKTAAITSWRRVSAGSMPPRVKAFANYHNGRLGNIDAQSRGADWPIFLNEHDQVTESSGATIALVKDGIFYTPAMSSGILQGVTRETVLEILRDDLGISAVETSLDRTDLALADEVMFLGTSAEILPIVAVDGRTVGAGTAGPVTTRLREEYTAVLRGRRPARMGWLTPVPGSPFDSVG